MIWKELAKVKTVDLSQACKYKDADVIKISRKGRFVIKQDKYYIIKLDNSLLNPKSHPTLVSNWNGNKYPTREIYKVEINKIMQGMIKVNAISNDDMKESFCGWLPINLIEVLEEI